MLLSVAHFSKIVCSQTVLQLPRSSPNLIGRTKIWSEVFFGLTGSVQRAISEIVLIKGPLRLATHLGLYYLLRLISWIFIHSLFAISYIYNFGSQILKTFVVHNVCSCQIFFLNVHQTFATLQCWKRLKSRNKMQKFEIITIKTVKIKRKKRRI